MYLKKRILLVKINLILMKNSDLADLLQENHQKPLGNFDRAKWSSFGNPLIGNGAEDNQKQHMSTS